MNRFAPFRDALELALAGTGEEIEMLDMLDTVTVTATVMINLVVLASVLPLSTRGRVWLAAAAGLWVGLATAAANSGALAFAPGQRAPVIGLFVAFPLIAAAGSWLASKSVREALLKIPTALLLGLNGLRVLGVLFIALAFAGRLSGPFPYVAGLGDVITGVIGASLAMTMARGVPVAARSIRFWNIFGALDLFVAVALGITSSQGPLQIFKVGVGSEAVQHFPFAIVPTVLVPFYLIIHGVVAAQLAERRRRQNSENGARLAPKTAGNLENGISLRAG